MTHSTASEARHSSYHPSHTKAEDAVMETLNADVATQSSDVVTQSDNVAAQSNAHVATQSNAQPKAAHIAQPGNPHPESVEALKHLIMANRGTEYPEAYSPKNLINPSTLKDGEKAALRIAAALIRRQRIILVADFDCDGATGAAIMKKGLGMISEAMTRKGGKPDPDTQACIDIVIPDRFTYGYGLKPELAIEVIRPLNPDLIITIDNGISSHDAADLIRTWGATDLIITDHHLPGDSLPNAYAVVNPTQKDCQYESKALCGAGVAFHLLMLVRRAIVELIGGTPRGSSMASRMRGVALNHLSDLVALGTIGDMVPMDKNNRLLTAIGLARINKGFSLPARSAHEKGLLSYGMRALLDVAGVTTPVTTSDLAFQLVPRINSVGRLTQPVAGVNCLLADNPDTALELARECDALNTERKHIQATMEAEARAELATVMDSMKEDAELSELSPLNSELSPLNSTILHRDTWHTGLVGLIASRIKERTGGAVVCFAPEKAPNPEVEAARVSSDQDTQTFNDSELPHQELSDDEADINWLKGSGRSDNVHLRDALAYVAARAPDLMMQFGGHARAAGLTLYRPHLPKFRRLFAEAVDYLLTRSPLENQTFDDGRLPSVHRSFPFAHWIEQQPWGQHFPEPQFTQTFHILEARTLKDTHQRLLVADYISNTASTERPAPAEPFPMMWFFSVDDQTPALQVGQLVTLTYRLTVNRFNGRNTLQGVVVSRATTD